MQIVARGILKTRMNRLYGYASFHDVFISKDGLDYRKVIFKNSQYLHIETQNNSYCKGPYESKIKLLQPAAITNYPVCCT